MESAQIRLILHKEKIIQHWLKRCEERQVSVQLIPRSELIDPVSRFLNRICAALQNPDVRYGSNSKITSTQENTLVQHDLQTALVVYQILFDAVRDTLQETGGYSLEEFETISQIFLNESQEMALSYSQFMTTKNRDSKKAFLTKLSHEIRTPLNSIIGFTDLIKNEHLSKWERSHYIDIIGRNGSTLSALVDDLIEVAKTEAGIVPVEKAQTQTQDPVKSGPESIPVRYASNNILKDVNILLVEDMKDNQLLIETYLRKTGAKLDIANDGAEGVEKALNKNYDVILMDIQMPVLDGNRAARKLREAGYHRPLIALTAHAMKEEVDRSMRAGFNSLVSKPIDSKKLFNIIQTTLSETTAH